MPEWRFWRRRGEPVEPALAPAREPRIRGSRAGLPYSKGRMAQTLMLSGFDAERAYQLAQMIEREVASVGADEISTDQLHELVEHVLGREDTPAMLARYHGWMRLARLDRPLVLLIGGATGTGKSSLATEIAYRLGISRITSTDAVRQVMRTAFAAELLPALHYSSFEAGDGLKIPMPDPDAADRALYGFIQQAEQVAVGANAIIDRAVMEGLSTVVEGVHLVPGLVAPERHAGAVVVQVMLVIGDEDAHQAHFMLRDYESSGSRAMERYLRRFGEIRRIQDYLVAQAERMRVPVIEAGHPDDALVSVMDLILEQVGAVAPALR
ncbi:MAG: ATP cone domain-containing protein [Gaiellales bacterium]